MEIVRGDWFYILLVAVAAFFMTRPYLYVIQQDNYRISEIFKSRRLGLVYLFDLGAVLLFGGIWAGCYFVQTRAFWGFVTVLFFFIGEFAMYFMEDLPKRKKPLKYTKRAVRCLVFVTLGVTGTVTAALALANAMLKVSYLRYGVFFAMPVVYPALFATFAAVVNVFERLNNFRYMRRTKRILAADDRLIKIAITGSFGKTSVKNFLHAMLAQKYNVLSTPASFNTPMGVSKTVAQLDETYDVFICEMGARRKGDIRQLMDIVRPRCAVLTGINSQHLETFRTQDNIDREKCKVLVEDGFNIVASSARLKVEKVLERRRNRPDITYAGLEGDDFFAEDIRLTEEGTAFTLALDGGRYDAYTPLIGRHNVENIVLAAACAYKLGVEIPLILDAIDKLEPVPHRMQLIKSDGIKIIDDSFNSNPDGAAAALDALQMFEGRRVVLTPGLVELGGKEKEENYRLGINLCTAADLVLLVGARRTDPIRRGLLDGGFGGEIHIYDSLKGAEDDFKNRLNVGDVLLILNDLPDIYDDKASAVRPRRKRN